MFLYFWKYYIYSCIGRILKIFYFGKNVDISKKVDIQILWKVLGTTIGLKD